MINKNIFLLIIPFVIYGQTYDINNKKLIALNSIGSDNNDQYFVDAYDPVTDSWEPRTTLSVAQGGNMDESVAYDSESDKTILVYFSGQTIFANSYDYSIHSHTGNLLDLSLG